MVTLQLNNPAGLIRTDLSEPQGLQAWFKWLNQLWTLLNYLKVGTGTPESVVAAPVGTMFLRIDGGVNTTLYVKQVGAGNTGWAAK